MLFFPLPVPKFDPIGKTSSGNGLTVAAEVEMGHLLSIAHHRGNEFPVSVQQFHGTIPTGRGEEAAIGTEAENIDPEEALSGVLGNPARGDRLSIRVPQLHHPIPTAGGDRIAVGAELNRRYRILVGFELFA